MTQSPAKKSFFNRNVDLMNGPIFKSLFIFMLPILVSCLFQQLYNTVDTMIVGNVLGSMTSWGMGYWLACYRQISDGVRMMRIGHAIQGAARFGASVSARQANLLA